MGGASEVRRWLPSGRTVARNACSSGEWEMPGDCFEPIATAPERGPSPTQVARHTVARCPPFSGGRKNVAGRV